MRDKVWNFLNDTNSDRPLELIEFSQMDNKIET